MKTYIVKKIKFLEENIEDFTPSFFGVERCIFCRGQESLLFIAITLPMKGHEGMPFVEGQQTL